MGRSKWCVLHQLHKENVLWTFGEVVLSPQYPSCIFQLRIVIPWTCTYTCDFFICSLKIHLIYLFLAIYILSAKTYFFKLHVYQVINSWHLGFFLLKRHIFIKASTEVVSYHTSIVLSPPWWWHWYKKKIDKFIHFWKIIKN